MSLTEGRSGRFAILALAALCLMLAACGSSHHGASVDAVHADFLNFSKCMRSHGVPNFPDPSAGGGISLSSDGIDPQSPSFQSAQVACKHLLPGGGPPPATEAQKRQAVRFAECMRAHGVPNFPDPTFPAGGGVLQGGPAAGINPQAPAFRHAASVCGGPNGRL